MDGRRAGWLAAALCGCGTETGNPEFGFEYNARTTDPSEVALVDGPGAVAERVWLRLGEVELRGDCDGEQVEATFDGLGFADHADPAPARQTLALDADSVCAVHTALEVDPAATGEEPWVAGAAVGIAGVLADGRPFEVVVAEEVPLSFSLPDEPLPTQGSWLVAFDVATWLDAGALEAVDADVVRVDAASDPERYGAVLDRLRQGVSLNLDLDGDGQIDPGDRTLAP